MSVPHARQRGFTLLEMALTLFSVGFLLSAVPQLIQQGTVSLASAPGTDPAEAAELALKGFALAKGRLPCPTASPDLAGSTVEDCSLASGFVPFKVLGLAQPVTNAQGHPFAYGVLRGENHLGQASARYTPRYLVAGGDYAAAPGFAVSEQVNGLDFCAKLRDQSLRPFDAALLSVRHWEDRQAISKMRNPAWVLVNPGVRNADSNNASYPLFGADNQPLSRVFDSPGRPATNTYDDQVHAASLAQLYGELRCPGLLAAASAAAREADYALDHWRVRSYLHSFRSYELRVREQKAVQAANTRLIQIFNLSMTVSSFVLDLGIALASGSGAISIAATAVAGITAVTLASIGVQNAIDGVASAQAEVTEGRQRRDAASAAMSDAAAFRNGRVTELLRLDQRGWFQ